MRIEAINFEKSLKDHEMLAKENKDKPSFQSQIITSFKQELKDVKSKLELKNKGEINGKLVTSNPSLVDSDLFQLILEDSQLDPKSKEQNKKMIEQINLPQSISFDSNQKPKEQKLSSTEGILDRRMKTEMKKFEEQEILLIKDMEQSSQKTIENENVNSKQRNIPFSSEAKKNVDPTLVNQTLTEKKDIFDPKVIVSITNCGITESDKSFLFSIIKQWQDMVKADKLKDAKIEKTKKELILRNTELDKIHKELAQKKTDYASAKKDNDLLIKSIAEMKIKATNFEKSLKEHEMLAKKNKDKSSLQSQNITSLHQELNEVKAKLELKYKGEINEKLDISNPNLVNFDLIQLILQDSQFDSKSKEHIKKLIEQINQSKSISFVSNQKPKKQKLSSIEEILDQRMKTEMEKFEEQKLLLIKDMEQKSQKIIERENENEELKIRIKKLESIVNDGSHDKEQKIVQLQKNIDQATKIYHQILDQVSSLKIEKQLLEKKLDRSNERFKTMEKQIETLHEKLQKEHLINLELKQKYGEEADEALLNIRLSSKINVNSSISAPTNVVRKILGGGTKP